MHSDHIHPSFPLSSIPTPADSFLLPNKFYLHACFGSCKSYSCSHAWLPSIHDCKDHAIPHTQETLWHCPPHHLLTLTFFSPPPSIMFVGPWGRWYNYPLYVWACKCYQFFVLSPVNPLSTTKISLSKQGWKWPWTDCLNINIQKAVFYVYLL